MNLSKISLALSILLLFLLGCASQPTVEESAEIDQPMVTAVAELIVTEAATDTATAPPPTVTTEPTDIPSPTETPEPTAEPTAVVTNCVLCHSDKDLLIDTADPEEEKEPGESSGVG